MASSRSPLARFLLLALLALAGCSKSVTVRGPALVPARVPVRVFPQIWVTGGASPEDTYLQDRLAAHLAQDGGREVRRVAAAELEPARSQGAIPLSAAVVWIETSFESGAKRYWDTAPVQYCGYYGCGTDYQSTLITALEVRGNAKLTVYEGPTARVLQEERFEQVVIGDDADAQHAQALELLAIDLERAVDVLKLREKRQLYKVNMREVKAALEHIRRGRWEQGRAELEKAAKRLGGKDKRTQARVWYNLGIARWYAPGEQGLSQEAYEAAARALRLAAQLEPGAHHRAALEQLDEARARFAVLEEQRKATAHNFQAAAKAAPPEAIAPEGGASEPRPPTPAADGGTPEDSGAAEQPAPAAPEQPAEPAPQQN